jgi:UDP-N-acetyl-D-glucosamine dehydrogenase
MNLKEKIKNKEAKVAVVGLGYVGLPQAILIAKAGFSVLGVDVDKSKIENIRNNHSYIGDIKDKDLKSIRENYDFKVTSDFSKLEDRDVITICVPTPLNKNKAPDVSYIEKAGESIGKYFKSGSLVVLESTSFPGTTKEVLKPILEKGGKKAGEDFYLAFSPERINPGSKIPLTDVPKVVGAFTEEGRDATKTFYEQFIKKVHLVSSPRTAEMTKILENTYRLVNISMINELALLAGKLDIDIWEVIEAAKTKPYGFQAFYPCPKIGGHCIPLDPFYLSWKAREKNFWARFIEYAGEINEQMPHYVVTGIITALNRQEIPLSKSKILVWGVTYKKDINDARESAAYDIIPDLLRKGAKVDYFDPNVEEFKVNGKYLDKPTILKSIDYSPDKLKDYDLVLILTAHSGFDYEEIAENSNLVFDTRNAIKSREFKNIYRV